MMIMISVGMTTIRRPMTILHIMIIIRFELKSYMKYSVSVYVYNVYDNITNFQIVTV